MKCNHPFKVMPPTLSPITQVASTLPEPKTSVEALKKSNTAVVVDNQSAKAETQKDEQRKSSLKQINLDNASLAYSVDQENNELHLKITKPSGDTVRELTFKNFDPGIEKTQSLKGILVDQKF